jgi:PAT family beta-lactamase induction signal transducer AmpG
VLFLIPYTGMPATYVFVAAVILSVTLFVVLPMKEPQRAARPAVVGSKLGAVGRELGQFARDAFRAFTGSRAAWVGVIFALLPIGAYGLSLALQSNLAVELGLNDNRIAQLNLGSTVISALCCVAGGWLSDRLGRRKMLALYVIGTAIPGFVLAWIMYRAGWIMPVDPQASGGPMPSDFLVSAFWTAVLVFSAFNGLMYGTRTALFMDITTPAVAATQFTAYMAMFNLVIAYTASWQGWMIEAWGYPVTLVFDGAAGMLCLACLPFMVTKEKTTQRL